MLHAYKYASKYGPITLGICIILASALPIIISAYPIFLENSDDLDAYFPLYAYFIENLHHGEISYYHPFLFAGERLLGNATFQPNPLELLVGFLFGPTAIYCLTYSQYMLEPITAFIGMYFLLGLLCKELPNYSRGILSLTYVFSLGYYVLMVFPTMTLQFATLPWIIYCLVLIQDRHPWKAVAAALIVLFYVQLAYGFLQFSVYVVWLSVLFALFWPPWPEKLRVTAALAATGIAAALMSAHFLVPVIDTLYFSEGSIAGRAVGRIEILRQIVPAFYLVRLFIPGVFQFDVPWWPIWRDGWSLLESFSAYEGLPISLLAVFGLFLPSIPGFFRAAYVFLVVSITLPIGIPLLYIMNLGSTVPFGRQTVLIGLIAPIIAGYTIAEINRNRGTAAQFAAWSSVTAGLFLLVLLLGFPRLLIRIIFTVARVPDSADAFIATYSDVLRAQFFWPFACAAVAGSIAGTVYLLLRFDIRVRKLDFPALLTAVLLLIALWQAYDAAQQTGISAIYANHLLQAKSEGRSEKISIGVRHPVENALIAAGAQAINSPVKYRAHIDITFSDQRREVDQIRRLSDARPEENRFRTLPNFLASDRIAVTTGYQNVIPQATEYSELLIPHRRVAFERAVGERAVLHPFMLQAFGIKWVLRNQPFVTENLHSLPDFSNDVWERRFLASSKLIYSDATYRLYEYNDARPVFDVPERIAFGDSAADTFLKLENPNDAWPVTTVVPEKTLDALGPDFASRVTTESGIKVIHQGGKIVDADGEAGAWTKLTVTADQPALVLIGTKNDPWWKVTVNGQPTPLIKANGVFAAVPVPAGKSEIVVQLRPYSVWVGTAISAATFLALAFGFLIVRQRRNLPGLEKTSPASA